MTRFDIDDFRLPRIVKCNSITAIDPSVRRTNYDGEIAFNKTYAFRNGLPWAVTVVEQSGIAYTIPRIEGMNPSTNCLEVEVRYAFNHTVSFDIYHLLNEANENSSLELQAIREHFLKGNIKPMSRSEFVLSYKISREQLNHNLPPVHIKELNYTFFIDRGYDTREVIHPYSDLGTKLSIELDNHGTFQYGIEIVDPNNIFGERFINIANRVFRVRPSRSTHKEPGVYVNLTLGSAIQLDEGPDFIQDYYSFKQATTELHLFKNAQEAADLGDLKEIATKRKLEIESRITENKLLALDRDKDLKDQEYSLTLQNKSITELENKFKLELQQLKAESAKVDAVLTQKTQDYNLMKMERDAIMNNISFKHTMDKYNRSDTSELLKWIPLIAVAVGALVKTLL